MIRIYGIYRSRATRNYWLLGELGLPFESVPVIQAHLLPDPFAPGVRLNTRSPEFLRLSPAGAIPVMEDNGFVLSESLAINLYLARKAGGSLAPRDAQEDALMQQWAIYAMASVEPHSVVQNRYPKPGAPDAEAALAACEAAATALDRPFKVLDAHLKAEGHMVGGRFTVADINMAEVVRYAQGHPTLIGRYPAVEAWLKSCQDRPAFKAMWAKRTAEAA